MNGNKSTFDFNQSASNLTTSKISITRVPKQTNNNETPPSSSTASNQNNTIFKVRFSDNVTKQVNVSSKKTQSSCLSKKFGELQNNKEKPIVNLLGWELEEDKVRKTLRTYEEKYFEDSSIEKDIILSPILDIITKKINQCTLNSPLANSLNLIFRTQKQISYKLLDKKDRLSDYFGLKRQAMFTDLNKLYLKKKYDNSKPEDFVALKETDEIFVNFTTLLMNALIRINSSNLDDLDLFNKIYYEKLPNDNIFFEYVKNLRDKKNFNYIFLNQLMNEINLTLIDDKDLTSDELKNSKLYTSIHSLLIKCLKNNNSNFKKYFSNYFEFTKIYYSYYVFLKNSKYENMFYILNEFKIFIFDMFLQLSIELIDIKNFLSPIYFLMNHALTTNIDPRIITNFPIKHDFKLLNYKNKKDNIHIKVENISDEIIKHIDEKRSQENKTTYELKTYKMNLVLVEAEYKKSISSEIFMNSYLNDVSQKYQSNENNLFQSSNDNLLTQDNQLDSEALNLFNLLATLPADQNLQTNSDETIFQNLNDDFFSNFKELNPIDNEHVESEMIILNEPAFDQTSVNINFDDLNDQYKPVSNNDFSQKIFNENEQKNSSEIIQKEEADQLIEELIIFNDELVKNQSSIESASQKEINDVYSFNETIFESFDNEIKSPIIKIIYKEMDCNLNSSIDDSIDILNERMIESPVIQLESPREIFKDKKQCMSITPSRNILKNVLDQIELDSCEQFQDIKNYLKESAIQLNEINLFKNFKSNQKEEIPLTSNEHERKIDVIYFIIYLILIFYRLNILFF
jgi:hypothetical protein